MRKKSFVHPYNCIAGRIITSQIQCRQILKWFFTNGWPRIIEHSEQLTKYYIGTLLSYLDPVLTKANSWNVITLRQMAGIQQHSIRNVMERDPLFPLFKSVTTHLVDTPTCPGKVCISCQLRIIHRGGGGQINNILYLARKYAGIFSAGIVCSKILTISLERISRKTVSEEQSCQIEALVFLILQVFYNAREKMFTNGLLFAA